MCVDVGAIQSPHIKEAAKIKAENLASKDSFPFTSFG